MTYRKFTNFTWSPLIGITSADYGVVDTITGMLPAAGGGGSVTQDVYAPLPGVELPPGNGREQQNSTGYNQAYWGWEANFIKRLSNRWMARIGYSFNDHREYFPNPAERPTPIRRRRPRARSGTAAWSSRAPAAAASRPSTS